MEDASRDRPAVLFLVSKDPSLLYPYIIIASLPTKTALAPVSCSYQCPIRLAKDLNELPAPQT